MSGKKTEPNKKEEELDCDCYSKSRTAKGCPAVQNVTHPLRYYEFTQDEIKALEECDKESFYNRCIPFSTLFATVTYAAIKWGCLKKSPHFGVYPKVLVAALCGHLYGRYTYIPIYDEKLRALPSSSYLGQVMRKHHLARHPPPPPPK